MAAILPPVFLLVAVFLLNVSLSRLVATERSNIGLLKSFGYTKLGADLNVTVPGYFEKLGGLLRGTDPNTLQAYLRWHILRISANALSKDIVDADFQFTSALTGAKELSPRWERCVGWANMGLGELVGYSSPRIPAARAKVCAASKPIASTA